MRKDCFKGYTDLKRLCYSEREKEREGGRGVRALLECRKVMLNYTIHELNRTVLIKKGQDLQSYRWLNSKLSLQEQGLTSCLGDGGVTGQALRAGLRGPLGWGSSLTHTQDTSWAENASRAEQQAWVGCSTSLISFSLLSLLKQSFTPAALFANHAAKAWLFYLLFVCLFACLKENWK